MAQKTDYKWLQVRLTPDEHEVINETAIEYNVDISTLVRAALNHVIHDRPMLEIRHAGKLFAPESMTA